MLEAVVEEGTASHLRTSNYKFAGKTGTALIATPDGYGAAGEQVYQSSFSGYFPADNPLYSIIVVIAGASEGIYHGGRVAGPVFREIADKIFANSLQLHLALAADGETNYKNNLPQRVSPSKADEMNSLFRFLNFPTEASASVDNDAWGMGVLRDSVMVWENREVNNKDIPDVRGMVLSDALFLLENLGMQVETRGTGKVVRQSVLPGTRATSGRKIELILN